MQAKFVMWCRISGRNLCKKFWFMQAKFVMWCRLRTCSWCIKLQLMCHPILARALTNGVQQLIHSAPSVFFAKNHRSEVAVMLKMKLKQPILRGFPGYWWLFWMQHLSRYSTRLFEEERKRWTIPIFDHFRLVNIEQVLDMITFTVNWGSLYKLF